MKNHSFFGLLGVASILLLVVFTTSQCQHEPIGNINNTGIDTTHKTVVQEDTNICFERDILPLFVSNCATTGCHDAASRVEGLNLTNYTNIMRGVRANLPNNSKYYTAITSGFMPPYTVMPPAQLALIKKWILQGAKNGTNCPVKCDSTNYAFAKGVQPVLNTYCVGCHTSANAGGGIILDNYSGVKSAALSGKLMGSISGTAGYSFMPKGGAALNSCQQAQIRKWIAAGCLNN